ncbi:MAG: OadG family protein [Oscillospiraceae bacterium]|nr:OadG family protein [Oscillospiraceae bacterium]
MDLMAMMKDPSLFETLSFGQKMTGGLYTMILGLGITFIALIVLMFATKIMHGIMSRKANKEAAKTAAPAESLPTTAAAARTATAAVVEDDDEIIAVITAAVASLTGGAGIVKNIYRAPVESGWTASGREELFGSRRISIQKRS